MLTVSDEFLLPQMKRVDGMISDNRKRLLHKLHIGQVLKVGWIDVCCVITLTPKDLRVILQTNKTATQVTPLLWVLRRLSTASQRLPL